MSPAEHPDSTDPMFSEPYVDVDEWRYLPVRHRYVHGGFRENRTRVEAPDDASAADQLAAFYGASPRAGSPSPPGSAPSQ